jgi:enoyl-CoA hydratase/carnithine racemase
VPTAVRSASTAVRAASSYLILRRQTPMRLGDADRPSDGRIGRNNGERKGQREDRCNRRSRHRYAAVKAYPTKCSAIIDQCGSKAIEDSCIDIQSLPLMRASYWTKRWLKQAGPSDATTFVWNYGCGIPLAGDAAGKSQRRGPNRVSTNSNFITDTSDGVMDIVLNRPKSRNALTPQMMQEFDELLDDAEADDRVKAVMVRGNGPVFCAGHDLKEAVDLFADGGQGPPTPRSAPRAWYFPKPMIAGVHGYVGPGGFEITASSDFIIAAEGTRWSFEINRAGGIAPSGAYMILHFQLPMRVLNKLWMMGGYFNAEEALQWNFVQRVVPLSELEDATRRWAEQAGRIPIQQYAAAKESLHRTYEILGLNSAIGVQNMVSGHGSDVDLAFWETVQRDGLKAAIVKRDQGFDDTIARV